MARVVGIMQQAGLGLSSDMVACQLSDLGEGT